MATDSVNSLPIIDNTDTSEWSSEDERSKIRSEQVVKKTQHKSTLEKTPPPDLKNKKKRKKIISVCLTHCRYDVIRRTAAKFGYREVTEGENWNMYWTDLSITVDRCKEMKRFQKINHFPGMLEICRKDLLARNLNRMQRLFPRDYNFFPKTWCLPADLGEAITYNRLRKNKTFILKPEAGSQGRGIVITKALKDIRPCDRGICQVYIAKPFLIDGYKFDLRVYTLLTSCDPMRIYIYNEGLVRFATSRYREPNGVNITNVFMHLTNYAVNKHSRTYNQDTEGGGSKRKLSWFNSYLKSLKHDVEAIWYRIDDVIIKTIISAYPVLKHSYAACFPNHDVLPACCELLGIDILLDKRLNPQVLEVNHSPSFHTDTPLDTEVKENLLCDMFTMMNLENCDKRKIMREDRKRIRERLLSGSHKDYQSSNDVKVFNEYFKQEMHNRGGFRLVYPCSNTENTYVKFFEQGQNTLYSDTASSRAREAAHNALRDELQLRSRIEVSKRVAPIEKPVKPSKSVPKLPSLQTLGGSRASSIPLSVRSDHNSSFDPQAIVDSEEKERLKKLAHRDFLVRSQGILELVYFSMKKNNILRPQDERKYAIFDKIRHASEYINKSRNGGPEITDMLEGLSRDRGAGEIVTAMKKEVYPCYSENRNDEKKLKSIHKFSKGITRIET